MKRVFNVLIVLGVFTLAIRVTSLEKTVKDLERQIYDNDFSVNHRMQEYESYVEYLEREFEPILEEEFRKSINERV